MKYCFEGENVTRTKKGPWQSPPSRCRETLRSVMWHSTRNRRDLQPRLPLVCLGSARRVANLERCLADQLGDVAHHAREILR